MLLFAIGTGVCGNFVYDELRRDKQPVAEIAASRPVTKSLVETSANATSEHAPAIHPAPKSQQLPSIRPLAITSPNREIFIQPGDRVIIPVEARIILRGSMEATIVNTAQRITAWSGAFKLQHEGTVDTTWSPDFSPVNPEIGVSSWLYRIKQSAAADQFSSAIRVTVDRGTVFLGTCAVAHECDEGRR